MFLTTSPIKIDAVQTANLALNDMLTAREPLATPARNYASWMSQRIERWKLVPLF